VTKNSWWKHIPAVQSINEVRFMKRKVSQTFLKHGILDFADRLSVCFLILYMNMLCIPHIN